MTSKIVRFQIGAGISMREVTGTLHLARLAAESLYGEERVELEVNCWADESERVVHVETDSEVGRTLAIVFAGYARREFGDGAVRMERSVEPEVAGAV